MHAPIANPQAANKFHAVPAIRDASVLRGNDSPALASPDQPHVSFAPLTLLPPLSRALRHAAALVFLFFAHCARAVMADIGEEAWRVRLNRNAVRRFQPSACRAARVSMRDDYRQA
jgi:hypothetical protein